MVKIFNHSEPELIVSFMAPAPAPAPQQIQITAPAPTPAPRKMLGSGAPSSGSGSGSPALLETIFLECVRFFYEKGQLPNTQNEDIVIMLSKPQKDLLLPSNYRPITSLNVGYKIIAPAINLIQGWPTCGACAIRGALTTLKVAHCTFLMTSHFYSLIFFYLPSTDIFQWKTEHLRCEDLFLFFALHRHCQRKPGRLRA